MAAFASSSSSSSSSLAAQLEACKQEALRRGPQIWQTFPEKVVLMEALYQRLKQLPLDAVSVVRNPRVLFRRPFGRFDFLVYLFDHRNHMASCARW